MWIGEGEAILVPTQANHICAKGRVIHMQVPSLENRAVGYVMAMLLSAVFFYSRLQQPCQIGRQQDVLTSSCG